MIPKFTLRALRGLDLPIHGDGLAVRSYLYVDDVAEAFMLVLARGAVGETYNIGTLRERSVLDVARDVCAVFGADAGVAVRHVRDRAFNDRRYYICDRKLAGLGWKEKTSWEEGLRRTIDWYVTHGAPGYWDNGSVDAALEPHPTLQVAAAPRPGAPAGGK
jgi:UDP-glucose 4,6-dehydratase